MVRLIRQFCDPFRVGDIVYPDSGGIAALNPGYCLASLRDDPNARKRAMDILRSPLCRKLRPKLCRDFDP
jgi:hypothetical protein